MSKGLVSMHLFCHKYKLFSHLVHVLALEQDAHVLSHTSQLNVRVMYYSLTAQYVCRIEFAISFNSHMISMGLAKLGLGVR